MRTAALLITFCLLVNTMAHGQAVVLQDGAMLMLRPKVEISSATAKTGDTVFFVVTAPLKVGDTIAIAADAPARGTVTKARHASGFGRNGELNLTIDAVQAVDGQWVKLRATSENKGANNAALSYGLAIFVNVFGFLIQGREAVIPATKEFPVYINEQARINVTPVAGTPTAASMVNAAVICKDVTPSGDPVGTSTKHSRDAASIVLWFQIQPQAQDAVFEVRWYEGSRLASANAVVCRAGTRTSWSKLSSEGGPLAAGAWRVEILQSGTVVHAQNFTVR